MEMNTVGIAGTVAAAPAPYRNIYGRENVYALWLDVARDSGTVDCVLVLVQVGKTEMEIDRAALREGSRVEATGTVQTYKDRETGHTQLFVWASYLAAVPDDSQQINTVYITGTVARQPVYRETPKGKHITDFAICVPSAFAQGFYSFIPCIAWERLAEQAAEMQEGSEVYLEGRVQSRNYTKKTPEGTRELTTWEISVNKLKMTETEGA